MRLELLIELAFGLPSHREARLSPCESALPPRRLYGEMRLPARCRDKYSRAEAIKAVQDDFNKCFDAVETLRRLRSFPLASASEGIGAQSDSWTVFYPMCRGHAHYFCSPLPFVRLEYTRAASPRYTLARLIERWARNAAWPETSIDLASRCASNDLGPSMSEASV
jgi:hypothetical protein